MRRSCSCGGSIESAPPASPNLLTFTCDRCQRIFYQRKRGKSTKPLPPPIGKHGYPEEWRFDCVFNADAAIAQAVHAVLVRAITDTSARLGIHTVITPIHRHPFDPENP